MRTGRMRVVAERLETTFAGRCARSFLALPGIDRALVLASQAFTALIPLMLLVTALAPADNRDVVPDALIGRFRLSGDAADAVRQLFAHSGSSGVGVLSGFLLIFSGVSLTRRMQRMYQQAWRLAPRSGVGHAVHAALGLLALVVGIGLLYLARALVDQLPLSGVLLLIVSTSSSFLLWISLPWLLLDRRLAWRRLVPGGLLTTVCTTTYGIASTVYMPRLLETYSRRYGLFGVTLALVGWLLAIAFIVVATTVVAAEFDRAPDLWAQRIRGRWGPGTAGSGPVGDRDDAHILQAVPLDGAERVEE
jgi:membrane protein